VRAMISARERSRRRHPSGAIAIVTLVGMRYELKWVKPISRVRVVVQHGCFGESMSKFA
jgi:hypothetical protein